MIDNDPDCWREVDEWVEAARVAQVMEHNRMGVMGHIKIAQGKTKVRPLKVYHGKVGRGLSVEMSVKHGPVTLLSVVQTIDGRLKLLVVEGQSVPGPILEIGNTNSRYRFSIGARKFVEHWNAHGPAHHCAVGVGHIAAKLEKLGQLLGMEVAKVG